MVKSVCLSSHAGLTGYRGTRTTFRQAHKSVSGLKMQVKCNLYTPMSVYTVFNVCIDIDMYMYYIYTYHAQTLLWLLPFCDGRRRLL